ncbi:MAG: alpha/beta fold hydrolase [Balneolaceae bacterium]
MRKQQKLLVTGLTTLLVCYVLICTFFYFIQVSIIFGPSPLSQDFRYSYEFDFEERYFETEPGVKVHAIHAKADSSAGLVVYLHGNRGNNRANSDLYRLFLENDYDVLFPDYRGYGKSTGPLWNEDDLIGDVQYIYSKMKSEYEESSIIIVGYSLGSGIAASVASENDPKALVLWTPYYSMLDLKASSYSFLPDFLVRFPLRTDLALQQIEEPVYIFYAENDRVLPVDRALGLTDYLKDEDEYYILEGQGHGGVYRNREVVEKTGEILKKSKVSLMILTSGIFL